MRWARGFATKAKVNDSNTLGYLMVIAGIAGGMYGFKLQDEFIERYREERREKLKVLLAEQIEKDRAESARRIEGNEQYYREL
mmetsp:Transcript_10361/g.15006  ORF Transcript_10361/g.15006 Transcript_10361/m.15006 type:complete len:83 (+) Transcript_10361:3-251(+)